MSSLAGALIPRQVTVKHDEMEDLFGNEDHDAASAVASEDNLPTPERERRRAQEYGEDDQPQEITVEVREALVEFPNIPVPKSSNGDNWIVRMPNFVKVDSKPFHPDTYIGPEHEDEEAQQAETLREKSMTIKLKVENTLRWRWSKDAEDQDVKQSNSRIIRWSDGSLSLRLGKELFDINKSIDTSGGSTSAGASQPHGLTYIVAQHKRSQVLQSEAVVTGYMTLRPTGMQSETHRMLVRAVGQKHNKVARLRMAPDPTMDPEREKVELIKQSARKRRKTDTDGSRRRSRKPRHSIWSDDEDDQAAMYASDEEDEDAPGASSGRRTKHRPQDDDKKDKEAEYQHDGFVVGDSDEEEGSEAGARRRRQDDDELDRLDAQIIENENSAKRRAKSGGNDDMDVESEEEEDEHRVQPLGRTGSRRRLVEEEEEDE
ncbi:Leo1-like protein-domain-containing protein [Mycena amicta]|nr:Leo1-like protein-domain-containing protein [Mycena amicta]